MEGLKFSLLGKGQEKFEILYSHIGTELRVKKVFKRFLIFIASKIWYSCFKVRKL